MKPRELIRIGVARKSFNSVNSYIVYKIPWRPLYQVNGSNTVLFRGSMEELKAWALDASLRIDATNKLGKELLNA